MSLAYRSQSAPSGAVAEAPDLVGLADQDDAVEQAIDRACDTIAPTWPLDSFIAVNPFWPRTHEPIAKAFAELGRLSGTRLLMPRAYYAQALAQGRITEQDLRATLSLVGSRATPDEVCAHLLRPEPTQAIFPRVMNLADEREPSALPMRWRDFIIHNTSQLCASYFDEGQASLPPSNRDSLYPAWLEHARADRGPSALMRLATYREVARRLPGTARETIRVGLGGLGIAHDQRERYLAALLLDLHGWASWCSYRRWSARLAGGEDHAIVDLLAIRVASEWILYQSMRPKLAAVWPMALARFAAAEPVPDVERTLDWVAQRALELSWETWLSRQLSAGSKSPRPNEVEVQAVFCIDARSEVMRRALEAQSCAVQTLGFAGFFGLPIDYQPFASDQALPMLPGLMAPRLRVVESGAGAKAATALRAVRQRGRAWKQHAHNPPSMFTYVEATGLSYALKLLTDAFRKQPAAHGGAALLPERARSQLRPRLVGTVSGQALSNQDRVALAAAMLKGMSLTKGFAPVVLLIGHGSSSVNNPHAAGLNCGACCGKSGQTNARIAAALLNDPVVRAGLRARDIAIPEATWFLPALHDTTTDQVTLLDVADVPEARRRDVDQVRNWLEAAGRTARRERASSLGLSDESDEALTAAYQARAADWAQVRPEWGLANNASFIVAPREHTRHVNLGGRAFLHEYRADDDGDGSILELILTAPMVVAHWINLQYYASTVDNVRYGSGNKVLHNVVGGHIGVFEGNGGDLRIGLPWQSVHDGQGWRHTPLRLSVFVEAPRARIAAVLGKHAKVRDLVDNGWVQLYQMDGDASASYAYRDGDWIKEGNAP